MWTPIQKLYPGPVKFILLLVPVSLCAVAIVFLQNVTINVKFYTPHLTELRCPGLSFSSNKLPITALASFPGSGNTWTRHLLQKMTGIATGAVYRDGFLKSHGFIGEGKTDGSVVAIKTHYPFGDHPRYDRVILIVRNPYESLLAEFRRRNSGHNQTGNPNVFSFIKNWEKYIQDAVSSHSFKEFYLSWLNHKVVLPVFYDNMKRNLSKELFRIASFLNISSNIQCALEDSEGIVHRRHSQNMPTSFFYSKEQIKEMNTLILGMQEKFRSRFPNITFNTTDWLL